MYPTRADGIASSNCDRSANVLGLHETLLGKHVASCARDCKRQNGSLNLSQISPSFATSLMTRGGKVAATMLGTVGDSGIGSPNWYFLKGESRERLFAMAERIPELTLSNEVKRCVIDHVISDCPLFMACACAFDGRETLPPFFPVMRNSDGVFANTLRACNRNCYIGHIPWTMPHDPPPRCVVPSKPGQRLSDLIISLVKPTTHNFGSDDVSSGLRMIGKRLQHVGEIQRSGFEAWLKNRHSEYAASMIRACEFALAESPSGPPFWQNAVKTYAASLRNILESPIEFVPSDLSQGNPGKELTGLTQKLILNFGELLQAWPEIERAAKGLRQQGLQLSEHL